METESSLRRQDDGVCFRNFLRGMETCCFFFGKAPWQTSETSLEGWKRAASSVMAGQAQAFRNFLRGMETMKEPRFLIAQVRFRNFLRGMETTPCVHVGEAPRPSETSLEGWKQRGHDATQRVKRPSETSLEGWKRASASSPSHGTSSFRNFLRGMETYLVLSLQGFAVPLPKLP